MSKSPSIEVKKGLELRPPEFADSARLAFLANDKDIASTTFIIEHPCSEQSMDSWIILHDSMVECGDGMAWVIIKDKEIVGVTTLGIDSDNDSATLAYWIGKDYWNQGIATEVAKSVLHLAFVYMNIVRVMAVCMTRNPASARVLEKIGMKLEGTLRSYQKKGNVYEDCHVYSILKKDYYGNVH